MNTNSRRQAAENQTLFQLQNPLNNLRFFQKVMLILPGMKAGWLPAMLEENAIAREVQAAPAQVAAHAELSQCRIRVVGQQPQHHGIERGPWWGLPCHCPPPPPAPTEQLPARKGGQDCTPEGQRLIITAVFSTIFNVYGNKLLTHLSVDNINIISVSNTQFHNITLKPMHIRKKIYSYVHSITSTDLHSIYKLRNSQN